MENIYELYLSGESIPDISKSTGLCRSKVRSLLFAAGILRSRSDAIRLASKKGKLGTGLRGKKREFTEQWKKNISISKKKIADITAIGVSKKPSGYIEYTRGENKGRSVHVVAMEKHLGRRLFQFECVHHKDENKINNDLSNLQLMTRSEHSRLHSKKNILNRKREKNGRLK